MATTCFGIPVSFQAVYAYFTCGWFIRKKYFYSKYAFGGLDTTEGSWDSASTHHQSMELTQVLQDAIQRWKYLSCLSRRWSSAGRSAMSPEMSYLILFDMIYRSMWLNLIRTRHWTSRHGNWSENILLSLRILPESWPRYMRWAEKSWSRRGNQQVFSSVKAASTVQGKKEKVGFKVIGKVWK